jgi:hypothetical protein
MRTVLRAPALLRWREIVSPIRAITKYPSDPRGRALAHSGLIDNPKRIILGGSMTGYCITDPSRAVVTPTTGNPSFS